MFYVSESVVTGFLFFLVPANRTFLFLSLRLGDREKMCDLPMSKLFLLCFRIQTKVRSRLSSSLSRIISLAPLVSYLNLALVFEVL